MKLIARPQYLDFLIRNKDLPLIKVITGVRRSGKSTLFTLYKNYLLSQGVAASQIISINLEDLAYEPLQEYHALYRYILEHLSPQGKNYIFLDEIQQVPQFEKVVDSLYIKENVDLYITGSNAYFLSGELATLLSGRYVQLGILPLSFKEYVSGTADESASLAARYASYVRDSAFPFALSLQGKEKNVQEYLAGIYSTILIKDTLTRLRTGNPAILESIMKYIAANVGSLISPSKIANALTSSGRKIDNKTVERYLGGLTDSLLLYKADRFDLRGKEILKVNAKYYLVDPAFRRLLMNDTGRDTGHILENIIYLELLRRGNKVFVGQLPGGEIDFVCENEDGFSYYQVALSTLDENVLTRELKPLFAISDQYPKYLLTLDEITPTANYDGIRKLNALQWLMDEAH